MLQGLEYQGSSQMTNQNFQVKKLLKRSLQWNPLSNTSPQPDTNLPTPSSALISVTGLFQVHMSCLSTAKLLLFLKK